MKMKCIKSDGTVKEIEAHNGIFDLTNQPERSKREDINYPRFECKKCKFSATQYRKSADGSIKCPECHEINDAVL